MVPLANSTAGNTGIMDSVNDTLTGAMNLFGQYTQIQMQKASAGGDIPQAKLNNELVNGATVLVEAPAAAQASGINVNSPLLIASVLVFGLAVYMKMNGAR